MNGIEGNYNGIGISYAGGTKQVSQNRHSFSTVMTYLVNNKSNAVNTENTRKSSVVNTANAPQNSTAGKESVVAEYKRKHPEDASHVEGQVNAGKKYLSKCGADALSREEMTMEEYQAFILGLLEGVPRDPSRTGDKEILSISDKGWEQMKRDPEYEAWIFGYTVENRAVRNPFAPWTGGMFYVEKFGASIEEHHGQSVSMNKQKGGDRVPEESWWLKRHKRCIEFMKDQEKLAQTGNRQTPERNRLAPERNKLTPEK